MLTSVHRTFPTAMLSAAKSSNEIPNSLPTIVMVVPPSRGPVFGLKSSIAGAGQFDPSLTMAPEHSSRRLQLSVVLAGPSHHPHSNLSTSLKLVHEEQPLVRPAQL